MIPSEWKFNFYFEGIFYVFLFKNVNIIILFQKIKLTRKHELTVPILQK